jgi:hypothetical protein
MSNAHKMKVENQEAKKQLCEHKRQVEDDNKMDSKEICCAGVDWIQLAQDRVQGKLTNSATTNRLPLKKNS